MVGNGKVSQDPSTLEMEFELQGSTAPGDGDITAVFAGDGLGGGGVEGDVTLTLADDGVTTSKIANRAVTSGKLSAAGSDIGQILTSTGSTLSWQDPPAGGGSGDITAVNAGDGLSGGGTTGDVTLNLANGGVSTVKIADNAVTNNKIADGQVLTADLGNAVVTKAKLSASGGSSGQVLGTNGSALVWQTPVGLSLPYTGTTTVSGDALYIGNTGSGRAIQAVSGADTALWAHSSTGHGVDARSDLAAALVATSNGHDGVQGIASASGKSGVYGANSSSSGFGVAGRNTYSDAFGALGYQGTGVWGDASTGGDLNGQSVGLFTQSVASESYAIFAQGMGSNSFSGWFTSRVHISGNLDVSGTKNFKIDHPLDPAGSYLVHAAMESSEVLNQYSGTAYLDENGTAVVELDAWFGLINTDLRYQLTPIGGAAPNLHISREVEENSFEIAGGPPGIKVSWQVTGRRNDAYMQHHPFQTEEAKTGVESGTYLCPECFDQPESASTRSAILTTVRPGNQTDDD
jgi:hypothetical protein